MLYYKKEINFGNFFFIKIISQLITIFILKTLDFIGLDLKGLDKLIY